MMGDSKLYTVLKPLTAVFSRVYFRIRVKGAEHVPEHGALLVVANHSSVLDPPLVGVASPRQLSFMAKADLFEIPLFGSFIWHLNARPIRREGADPSALRAALRLLAEERALLVFPEGTRGPEGMLRDPKPGPGMLAVLSGATVVPAFIVGSGRAWPKGRALPHPARVTITFGPALRFERRDDVDRKQQYEAASRAMMAAIARLGNTSGTSATAGASRSDVPELVVAGEAGTAPVSTNSTHGRMGQHGQG